MLRLSIVVPVFRGEATLADLVAELGQLKEKFHAASSPLEFFEAIFVDDGSTAVQPANWRSLLKSMTGCVLSPSQRTSVNIPPQWQACCIAAAIGW